ncbi:MAG: hypothetical protein A2X36_05475 [Elusimicrobia bacterium GWA2_69_24]|nr:MAG: hypothetical protein A2X36_05475 [Elusimicrobia bacterium GWA2_69_24]HBL16008.1 hypothetical protein [Elusimicrobiota bacterium]
MGRYFIQVGGKVKGPMEVEVIVGLRWFGPDSLLCPEAASTKSRHNWLRAQTFPEIRAFLRGPGTPGTDAPGQVSG